MTGNFKTMTTKHEDGVYSIDDIIMFRATPADVARMRKKIKMYLQWLEDVSLENNLDNWESFCEKSNEEGW